MKPQTSKCPKLITLTKGYIFCKILWLGEGDGARKKMKNEAVSNKMKKKEKGKRGKKKKKRKRGRVIFLLIYGILLLIIV